MKSRKIPAGKRKGFGQISRSKKWTDSMKKTEEQSAASFTDPSAPKNGLAARKMAKNGEMGQK